jgi:hypothetical protein
MMMNKNNEMYYIKKERDMYIASTNKYLHGDWYITNSQGREIGISSPYRKVVIRKLNNL